MTKVSKVYFGLSRVSREEADRPCSGPSGASAGGGGGAGAAYGAGIVDKGTSRLVEVSSVVAWSGCMGAGTSSVVSTVTAIRISRPKDSLSASSTWPRSRPSSWVRVNSLGTAMMAVVSCRVTG